MAQVCECLNIGMNEFGQTHQMMAQDPKRAEMVMAAQQGKYQPPDLNKKPSLSKQKTKDVIEATKEASAEMLAKLAAIERTPGEPNDKMLAYMCEQIKM